MSLTCTRSFISTFVFVVVCFLSACGVKHTVRPLQKGTARTYASLSGPLIKEGLVFPVPYTVVGYAHGISKRLTVYGEIHPSAMLLENLTLGSGAVIGLLDEKNGLPFISADVSFVGVTDFEDSVVFPTLSLIASYAWMNGRWMAYFGGDGIFQLHDDPDSYPQLFSPFIGMKWRFAKHWSCAVEAKWFDINRRDNQNNIDFVPFFGKHGKFGIGVLLSRDWSFFMEEN